jgi:2-amino-4-hydroxy-6-hydroxymethyldihydropteridine diphosphokinase
VVTRVYFSIGSNVEPLKYIELAVHELGARFGAVDISPVYRNKAIGFAGADFLNLVVGVDTDKSIDEICSEIVAIHTLANRVRDDSKFVARTLDIDLLLYGQLITDGPPLHLPRVDVLKYSFALKPLADIAPEQRHPETGKSYAEHWLAMDSAEHPLKRVEVNFTSRDFDRHQPQ